MTIGTECTLSFGGVTAMGPYSTPLLENNVHIVCTSIEDNGDHWNRMHLIFRRVTAMGL